ncbi:hypothetical protein LWI29_006080 [Acer saccharum]|uniref:Uncharacterized protein n=1 Tax=Acer saccharum TaxID=4024 RepID=A0AA39VFT4_ACESA|nr:hypothetical protein LWI29_006080 [Acer saccharum]
MKKLADNLALAGQPVDTDDLVSQVLAGLDSLEYDPVLCQLNEKEHVSWMELQSTLLSYERRLKQINGGISSLNIGQVSANFAANKTNNSQQNKGQNQSLGFNFTPNQNHNRYSRGNNFRGKSGRSDHQQVTVEASPTAVTSETMHQIEENYSYHTPIRYAIEASDSSDSQDSRQPESDQNLPSEQTNSKQ